MKISAVGISLASILALLASGPAQSQQQDRRPGTTKPAPKPQPNRPGRPGRPGAGRPHRPTPLPGPGAPAPPKPNPGNGLSPPPAASSAQAADREAHAAELERAASSGLASAALAADPPPAVPLSARISL